MTTIAANLEIMAGDTQATNGQGIKSYCTKIHKRHGCIIGFCGSVTDGDKFVNAFPNVEGLDVDEDFEALVLSKTGLHHYESDLHRMKIETDFFAIGSGASSALGALYAGTGPIKAVKIASRIDVFTGGVVRSKRL